MNAAPGITAIAPITPLKTTLKPFRNSSRLTKTLLQSGMIFGGSPCPPQPSVISHILYPTCCTKKEENPSGARHNPHSNNPERNERDTQCHRRRPHGRRRYMLWLCLGAIDFPVIIL